MHDRGTYNDSMIREFYETETPRFQHSLAAPEYTESQQSYETKIAGYDYDTYNDPVMMWLSNDIKIRTGDEPEERMDLGEVENPTIEQLMIENEQTKQNLNLGDQSSEMSITR